MNVRRFLLASCVLLAAACGDDSPTFLIAGDASDDAGGGTTDGGGAEDSGGGAEDSGGDQDAGSGEDAATSDTDPDAGSTDEICDNGVDDDDDGDVDCDDADCADSLDCGGTCGDGALDEGEECDDGADNSDIQPDACRSSCELPFCGDGVEDSGEGCDEGDDNGFGRCTLACTVVPVCGDGVTDEPELCDDGNDTPGDGCTDCLLDGAPECGDGQFTPAFEECEGDQGCAFGETCTSDCFCEQGQVCGNGRLEGDEECDGDAGDCVGNGFCSDSCECEIYECGDNSADGSEECDGTDDGACGVGEACSEACVCVGTAICGNDITEDREECDGADDAACGFDESCNESCECVAAICGNGVAEGSEECDGDDDALCGAGRVCDGSCACDGPPNLEPFGTPIVGGSNPVVIPAPNRSDDVCPDFDAPQGLQIRVTGDATADVVALEVQRAGFDPTPIRIDLDPPIAAGDFDERVDVCLPTFEVNRLHQVTLLDDMGRRSTTRSFTLPTLGGVTLTQLRVFLSRDRDAHVLQLTGASADRNIQRAVVDIQTDEGPIEDFVSELWPLLATYSGGQYFGAAAIGGLLDIDFTITGYRLIVETFGGLQSSPLTATPATTVAGSGAACVPVMAGNIATCLDNLWCQPGSSANAGTCRTPTGGAPIFAATSFVDLVVGSPRCDGDFPNELVFTISGSTSAPIYTMNFGIFDPDGTVSQELGLAPYDIGSFSDQLGLCITGTLSGETIEISLVDEAGRTSATRSFDVP